MLEITDLSTEEALLPLHTYPNPTRGVLHVNTPEASVVRVYATTGALLGEHVVANGEVDLSYLAPGTYLLSSDGKNNMIVKL